MILDGLFGKGELAKLTITALKDNPNPEIPPQADEKIKPFKVWANPGSYQLSYGQRYNNQAANGDNGTNSQYLGPDMTRLNFDILFDGTGVIPKVPSGNPLEGVPVAGAIAGLLSDEKEETVSDKIRTFNSIVYDYDGEQHRPKWVQIAWGDALVFYGVLKSLSYQFKLFKPDGSPLRAVATVSFDEQLNDYLKKILAKISSPDLTHIRTVQEGDTLPLMCYRTYGDSSLYLKVAKVNKLLNFRRLEVGSQLFFPPLEKAKK